ncbi:polysaccharide deacetylase family protein [Chryseobacterium gregarium]|uniref:polysaccharide deacetylase family protein n=1 Tax=Chryseobacterium gregarium TaxID=456299 RepID=UPI0003F77D25|nr:polysaccharide deacetylase family protein [Chryseobacterium gregarium]
MNSLYNKLQRTFRNQYLDFFGLIANPSNRVHLLNSHLLSLKEESDASFFDDQLKILSKKSTIIPFAEAVDLINKKKSVNHSLIAFSYDDGFAECYTHIAPVLEKYNGYAYFFINPNFVNGDPAYIENFLIDKVHLPLYKRPMNWEQIKTLADKGHTIGAHTMDHVRVSLIKELEVLEYQIGYCKKEILEKADINCNDFAFPYGHVGRDFDIVSTEIAEKYYDNIFSASNWTNYFSYEGRVFNRRHCEPYWKAKHINYFLSKKISY